MQNRGGDIFAECEIGEECNKLEVSVDYSPPAGLMANAKRASPSTDAIETAAGRILSPRRPLERRQQPPDLVVDLVWLPP